MMRRTVLVFAMMVVVIATLAVPASARPDRPDMNTVSCSWGDFLVEHVLTLGWDGETSSSEPIIRLVLYEATYWASPDEAPSIEESGYLSGLGRHLPTSGESP